MTTAYRLDIFDLTGALRAQLTGSTATDRDGRNAGFRSLAYTKRVNAPGLLQFVLRGDHELLQDIEDKWVVEVHRKPEQAEWYRDFVALYRQPEYTFTQAASTFVGICQGLLGILGWEEIAYPADIANRTRFINQPAETIAKSTVLYNRGAGALVSNGRKADAVYPGLSIQTDEASGNNLDYFCFGKNVLEGLQEIANIGGGDFDLERTGATTTEFQWFPGQRGIDKTANVIFSIERHNMAQIAYREKRLQEATLAYVWGQGDKDNRDCVVVTSPDYSAGNHHAITVIAADIEKGQLDALQRRGEQKLRELRSGAEFGFRAVQQPGSEYGVDYDVGDLVTAVNPFSGVPGSQKVMAATVSFEETREGITPEFATP